MVSFHIERKVNGEILMRIAVCDNERSCIEKMKKLLEKSSMEIVYLVFIRPEELLDAMEKGQMFDVVCMDIEWNEPRNGIDFASELVELSPLTQVIFITGYNDKFSQQIFLKNVNLCGFLVKPVEETVLNELLKKVIKNQKKVSTGKLLIQTKSNSFAIPYYEILYLESQAHQLLIHTEKQTFTTYGKLTDILKQLPDCFTNSHKSYLVNLDKVIRIEEKIAVLESGEEIPISKSRYTVFRKKFFDYLEKYIK